MTRQSKRERIQVNSMPLDYEDELLNILTEEINKEIVNEILKKSQNK